MKILLLADAGSSHIIRWAKALAKNNCTIFIIGLVKFDEKLYENYNNIQTKVIEFKANSRTSLVKLKYLFALSQIKHTIKKFRPDIVHAHYATSYGLLGALSGFHPLIISVWGSDIYDFPTKSFFHKMVIKYNLVKADKILSTSSNMALEIKKYINKPVEITPFGIDLNKFKPKKTKGIFSKNDIVIGTIKSLEKEYGIDTLIKSFKLIQDKFRHLSLRLLIVGGGSLENELKELVSDLNIFNHVTFTGKVNYDEIINFHNKIDIFAAISNNESFGVSIIEASACQKPVVVSNVGGLPEVVLDNITGLIIPPNDPQKVAEAFEKLLLDSDLCSRMGTAGRELVNKKYNLNNNVNQMIDIYENTIRIYCN